MSGVYGLGPSHNFQPPVQRTSSSSSERGATRRLDPNSGLNPSQRVPVTYNPVVQTQSTEAGFFVPTCVHQGVLTSFFTVSGVIGALIFNAAEVIKVPLSTAAGIGAAGSVICVPLSACMAVSDFSSSKTLNSSCCLKMLSLMTSGCGALVTMTGKEMVGPQISTAHAALIGAVGTPVATGIICVGGCLYLCCTGLERNSASVAADPIGMAEAQVMVNIGPLSEADLNLTVATAVNNPGVPSYFSSVRTHKESAVLPLPLPPMER